MWEGLTKKNLFLIANEVLKVKPEKIKAGHFDEEGKKWSIDQYGYLYSC